MMTVNIAGYIIYNIKIRCKVRTTWPQSIPAVFFSCKTSRHKFVEWLHLPTQLPSSFYSGNCIANSFASLYVRIYRMFLSLDLLWEYRIQHGANGPLYVISSYSTWIFCRWVSGFATDCPCSVWCRGLATCLLHVGPSFGNRILNNSQ